MSSSEDSSHLLSGIAAVCGAGFLLSGMDALGKYLMADLPPLQVVWSRFFFHTLIVGAVLGLVQGRAFLRTRRPGLQALRGVFLLGVTLGIYFAIRTVSLADATAIVFVAPVLVTVLAGPVLGEHVRGWHYLAVTLGFAGVLLIVQPGFRAFDPALLLPCGAALSLAFYFLLTRKVRGHDSESTSLFYATAVGTILLTLLQPLGWQPPGAGQWLLLVSMGVMGATGHLLLIKAFHLAPATFLSPFLNAQLVGAALYSAVFFDDVLELSFYAGAGLIVGAGLLVWARDERQRRRSLAASPGPVGSGVRASGR